MKSTGLKTDQYVLCINIIQLRFIIVMYLFEKFE